MDPLISVVVATYNREKTVVNTIRSILRQTWKNLEIIVVDDGSTDNTQSALATIKDERVRFFKFDENRGVTAAKNKGLDQIRGEWFTLVDSDDEILPDALETLIRIPLEIDPTITAVSCNCLDTGTQQYSGVGLDRDQYVSGETLLTRCRGDFWGITRTSLLGDDRFNERIVGFEGTLWVKVNARAKRFYVHRAFLLYHTEGADRISKKRFDFQTKARTYEALQSESFFLQHSRQYNRKGYIKFCYAAIIYLLATGKKKDALHWLSLLKESSRKGYFLMRPLTLLPDRLVKRIALTGSNFMNFYKKKPPVPEERRLKKAS